MNSLEQLCEDTSHASIEFRKYTEKQRQQALCSIASVLRQQENAILSANQKDLETAISQKLSKPLLDRLKLSSEAIENMAIAMEKIASAPQVVNCLNNMNERSDGLKISKQTVPLGVIGFIFESRPNVVIDAAALAIKSGNGIILKGGKEAAHSNHVLIKIIKEAIKPHIPDDVVNMIGSHDRQAVMELLKMKQWVDLIIPRGGESLIKVIQENSQIPVIAHYKGLCHVYVHNDAIKEQVVEVCLNTKVQRPSVCNAAETFLLNENLDRNFIIELVKKLQSQGVEVRGDKKLQRIIPEVSTAIENDWSTEYLDLTVSIKLVKNESEAIAHIHKYGSKHTECILAQDISVINQFKKSVDASCITVNASTRFNDGGELGLGAEIGISTTKFHAYGPMGAAELTTTRYIVEGSGHVRS